MSIVRLCRLLTVLLVSSLLSSCLSGASKHNEQLSFMMLKGPSALSMVHLMDSVSSFSNNPINYQVLNEPNQIRARLLQEEVDIALIPTNLAAILYNRGLPYRLVIVPVWGTLYLCGSDTAINEIPDLAGKHVYSMARGMNPDIILRCLLERNNLKPGKDVQIDYSFPSHIDLANAVKAGRADVAVLSEPQISLIRSENPELSILIDLNMEWKRQFAFKIPQTAILIHQKFLKEPDLVEQLLDAMIWSVRQTERQPIETAKLAVRFEILPDENIALSALSRCNIFPVSGPELKSAMEAYLEVFYNFNPQTIGGRLPDEGFIYY